MSLCTTVKYTSYRETNRDAELSAISAQPGSLGSTTSGKPARAYSLRDFAVGRRGGHVRLLHTLAEDSCAHAID